MLRLVMRSLWMRRFWSRVWVGSFGEGVVRARPGVEVGRMLARETRRAKGKVKGKGGRENMAPEHRELIARSLLVLLSSSSSS